MHLEDYSFCMWFHILKPGIKSFLSFTAVPIHLSLNSPDHVALKDLWTQLPSHNWHNWKLPVNRKKIKLYLKLCNCLVLRLKSSIHYTQSIITVSQYAIHYDCFHREALPPFWNFKCASCELFYSNKLHKQSVAWYTL